MGKVSVALGGSEFGGEGSDGLWRGVAVGACGVNNVLVVCGCWRRKVGIKSGVAGWDRLALAT